MASSEVWEAAMRAKGHTPIMDEGRLDIFVCDAGFHNGPGCETCGWSCCHHCETTDSIPQCPKPALELQAVEIKGELPAPQSPGESQP